MGVSSDEKIRFNTAKVRLDLLIMGPLPQYVHVVARIGVGEQDIGGNRESTGSGKIAELAALAVGELACRVLNGTELFRRPGRIGGRRAGARAVGKDVKESEVTVLDQTDRILERALGLCWKRLF